MEGFEGQRIQLGEYGFRGRGTCVHAASGLQQCFAKGMQVLETVPRHAAAPTKPRKKIISPMKSARSAVDTDDSFQAPPPAERRKTRKNSTARHKQKTENSTNFGYKITRSGQSKRAKHDVTMDVSACTRRNPIDGSGSPPLPTLPPIENC